MNANTDNTITITEARVTGTEWMRRYSNGFIEQGGYAWGHDIALIEPYTRAYAVICCGELVHGHHYADHFIAYPVRPTLSSSWVAYGY